MTGSVESGVTFGFSAAMWGVSILATLALAVWVAMQSGQSPSPRLSTNEVRFELSKVRAARLRELRAPRIPGRNGAWNALVLKEDEARLKAQLAGQQAANRIVAYSFVVGVCLLAAALVTAIEIFRWVAETNRFPTSTAMTFVGACLVVMCAWYAVPTLTMWILPSILRARTPFAWRLLRHGEVITKLSRPQHNKWTEHENPRDGMVTIETANRLLSVVEAEVIESFAYPRLSSASARAAWRLHHARRVEHVIESKARLKDRGGGEISVEEIYSWLDLVVEQLVNRKPRRRARVASEIIPELVEEGSLAQARRVLGRGFWRSPAGALVPLLAISVTFIGLGSIYPEFRSMLTPYPDVRGAATAIMALALAPVFAHLTAIAFRRRRQ